MIIGSAAVLPFRNSQGKDRIRKINDPLRQGAIWVPVGYVSDGASIPRIFWRGIGHPFSPLFIRPALLHDIRCEFKVGSARDTNEQFHANLIAEGVSPRRAGVMAWAVKLCGPAWGRKEQITPDDLMQIVLTREWGTYDG